MPIPVSGAVTAPAPLPKLVAVEPMNCATVNSALLRLSPGKL